MDEEKSKVELMIEERIRQNKELRSKKYSNNTSFKPGVKPPVGSGRKKGSKNKKKYKVTTELRHLYEEQLMRFLIELQLRDISKLTAPQLVDSAGKMAKVVMPDISTVHLKNTEIKKIEVSFSDEFGLTNTIDITPIEEQQIGFGEGDE